MPILVEEPAGGGCMATIELPLGVDWTPEILQGLPSHHRYELWEGKHKLVREAGAERYVETRMVMLSTLGKESL
jgi:hypothetical protein